MIYEQIAKYMDEKGIKQSFLSDKTGMSPPVISMMLNGKRKIEVEEYVKLCDALDVGYNFFIESRAG